MTVGRGGGEDEGEGGGGSSATARDWIDGVWDKVRSLITDLKIIVFYKLNERHLLRNRHNCC